MTEFQFAFHHNVAIKRKKRLVVLLALDSMDDLDDVDHDTSVLRQFIRQYTYIDYRRDDWLDRLLYALPLRGLLERNDHQTTEDSESRDDIQLHPSEKTRF